MVDNNDVDLETSLKLIVEMHEKGNNPVLDLIDLMKENDENCNKWKLLAQICSYSMLFKDPINLPACVEQFMMLIDDKNIANSPIVTVRN